MVACSNSATTGNKSLASTYDVLLVTGDSQTAVEGDSLPAPVVVRITNAVSGVGIANVVVNWEVMSGKGSVFVATTQTDSAGETRNRWTLGDSVGVQALRAATVNPENGNEIVFATLAATATAPPVASVTVAPDSAALTIGQTVQLKAVVKDAKGDTLTSQSITWSSSNSSVATVSSTGLVKAAGAGSAIITATSGGKSGTATITASNSATPSRIVAKFDGDSTVPVGTVYNVAQHFRFVVENSVGDSVGVSALSDIVSIAYVPTLGNGNPGLCEVPSAGVFSVYCPASDFPTTGAPLSYNGYWQATVQGAHVNGLPDSAARGTLHWHVLGVANSPISFVGKFDGDSTVAKGTAYNVAAHFHFIVEDVHGDSLTFSPVVNLPSIQWTLLAGQAPQTPPSCTVPTDVLALSCPASSGPGFNGYYTVTVQEGSFNGIANPSYRGTMHLYVGSTGNVQLHFVGKFDGDSSVAIGTPYNVSQHFHFVVEDASGDSVSSVPVVNLPSIQWTLLSGKPPQSPPTCAVPTGVLVLDCPASDFPSAFSGYYVVTVQQGSYNGISNPAYRGQFHLYVNTSANSPLSYVGKFDGDSTVAAGTPYDVTQHFHFIVADTQGDSVNSVPVVNLPSVQWVLQSGQAPGSPPSCTVAADVLVLNCPTSSGSGFTGFYVVTTQPGSFNGIANPSYRPTFDLHVSP